MDIKHRMEDHYKRWDIKFDWEEQFTLLKNRMLTLTNEFVGDCFVENVNLDKEFASILGQAPDIKSSYESNIMDFTGVFTRRYKAFRSTNVHRAIEEADNLNQLVTVLQVLFLILEKYEQQDLIKLAQKVEKAVNFTPSVSFSVAVRETTVTLYPVGAELLDEGSVNNVLAWLQRYPNVAKHFENALQTYQTGDASKYRNLLDDLRFALEQLLKEVLKNDKSLEKQNQFLLAWLKNQGVHQQLISMYHHLVENYVNYQNNAVKHNEAFSVDEIEFMIYLTGTFMRLLLQLAEKTN